MSKGLRLTEKWMQRGLWLVALLFAGFLIGLGSKVVENVWDVEEPLYIEQFMDPGQTPMVKATLAGATENQRLAELAHEQAVERHRVAQSNTRVAQDQFANWLATRQATARPEQDAELIRRTADLDALQTAERQALALVEKQSQAMLDASQTVEKARHRLGQLQEAAEGRFQHASTMRELRVFGYRLALTLPLLLIAGWLFAKKRGSTYWPFVWGFILFALFAFFVELVPYLPSYGGYVRYIVGIVLTVVVGRYAIIALQRYLARQKAAEALPDVQRRETLRYDVAFTRLSKSVCPGCERQVDLKDPALDFCPHCGIGLFDRCGNCNTRKGAFARFCFSCGTPGKAALPE